MYICVTYFYKINTLNYLRCRNPGVTTAQWNEILPSFDTPCSIPTDAAELRFRLKDIVPWIPTPIFNVILASSQAFSGFAHNICRFETACIVHDRCFNVRAYLAPRT